MLVISRKPGETVWIGDARIIVTKSKDGRVRLVVDAPKDVRVLRGELVGREARRAG